MAELGRFCSTSPMTAAVHAIVSAHYDRASDVLFVAVGRSREGDVVEQGRGLMLRYQFGCNEPIGATVIGYKANGWCVDRDTLAAIIADHLRIAPPAVAATILAAGG